MSYPQAQIATQQQQQQAGNVPTAQAIPQAHVVGVVNSALPTVQAQYAIGGGGQVPRGDQGWYDRVPRRIICQFCNFEGESRMRVCAYARGDEAKWCHD